MSPPSLQISAGTGPVEVRAFVARLAGALADLAISRGLAVEATALDGDPPRSARLFFEGDPTLSLGDLIGTHCLVARSERRGRNDRKRWFVDVRLLDEPKAAPELRAEDIEIEAFARSSGPGGQNVNKSATAVRVRHRPTGLQVVAVDQRSQHNNQRLALARLASALADRAKDAARQHRADARLTHHQLVRGAPVCSWTLDHDDTLVRSL